AAGSARRAPGRAREDVVGPGGAYWAALLRRQSAARAAEGQRQRVDLSRREYVRPMRSLIAAVFTALPAVAGPDPASVLRMLQSTIELHDVALSRDGARVGWVEQLPTPDGPSPDESIVQVLDRTTPSATPVRLTAGKDGNAHDEHDLDFSPDGRSLTFLSDAAPPHQLQHDI